MTIPVGTRLGDPRIRYPVAALNLDAVRHNIVEMDAYCDRMSVLLAPHAKTTMVREVLALQTTMRSTWGLTVADAVQARLADEVDAPRILIANQLVEHDDIAWVADRIAGGRTIMSLVDSVEGVHLLDAALTGAWRGGWTAPRHPVLLEVGYPGGRCGTRTWDDVQAVADAVISSQWLTLRGVSGFEGLLGASGDRDDLDRVDAYLRRLGRVATRLAEIWGVSGPESILSAGGSSYFDRVVTACRPVVGRTGGRLLLRSGCYAVHDHGLYARTFPGTRTEGGPALRAATAVWARVQSRPDGGRAVAAVGRRHLPHDAGFPAPLEIRYRDGIPGPCPPESRVVALSDQHLHLDVPPEADLRVGDVVPLGISHPCGLFDRWRSLAVVDDRNLVTDTMHPAF
jgi:D-serine dehydratase